MKETVLSNCEKTFIEKSILEKARVNRRELHEFRNLGIFFGRDFGCVICSLGETRVFAQVSCELSTPKPSRPNEGTIFINVEMGPMAAPHFEIGFPLSDLCIQVNRVLERTLRESRCVDLESLCIIAEEKVWNLRVDISVLNHEGNVMDCSCIAAVAALAHFKRPDVTTTGDGEFIIHTPAEKDLIPVVLHHYPICSSYALFDDGKVAVADPDCLEERVSSGTLVLAVNSYKELCCMHLAGVSLTSPNLISRCADLAATRSMRIVEFIKSALEDDAKEREEGKLPKGFAEVIKLSNVPSNFLQEQTLEKVEIEEDISTKDSEEESSDESVTMLDSKTAASKEWQKEPETSESSSEDEDMQEPQSVQEKPAGRMKAEIGDSSEEEETMVLK